MRVPGARPPSSPANLGIGASRRGKRAVLPEIAASKGVAAEALGTALTPDLKSRPKLWSLVGNRLTRKGRPGCGGVRGEKARQAGAPESRGRAGARWISKPAGKRGRGRLVGSLSGLGALLPCERGGREEKGKALWPPFQSAQWLLCPPCRLPQVPLTYSGSRPAPHSRHSPPRYQAASLQAHTALQPLSKELLLASINSPISIPSPRRITGQEQDAFPPLTAREPNPER